MHSLGHQEGRLAMALESAWVLYLEGHHVQLAGDADSECFSSRLPRHHSHNILPIVGR